MLPIATTERATSPLSTRARLDGSRGETGRDITETLYAPMPTMAENSIRIINLIDFFRAMIATPCIPSRRSSPPDINGHLFHTERIEADFQKKVRQISPIR